MDSVAWVQGGQLVVPQEVMAALGAVEGEAVRFEADAGRVVLSRTAGSPAPGYAQVAQVAQAAPGGGWAGLVGRLTMVVVPTIGGAALVGAILLAVGTSPGVGVARALGTLLALGVGGLLAIPSAGLLDRRERTPVGAGGLVITGLAVVLGLVAIWATPESQVFYRLMGTSLSLATGWSVASLLLWITGRGFVVDGMVMATIGLIGLAVTLSVVPLLAESDGGFFGAGYARASFASQILAYAAAIVTPLVGARQPH